MTGPTIRSTADVAELASQHGLTRTGGVAGLHESWCARGVEVTAQQQWPALVVQVWSAPTDEDEEWSARFTSGVPVEGVVTWIQLALAQHSVAPT